jgi:hypothetical protein
VQIAEQASGELSLAEWLPGDKLRTIISGNAQFPPQPMGALVGTALSSPGKPVVAVLRPDGSPLQRVDGVQPRAFSRDDRQLLYAVQDNGEIDLALLDVASGKITRLTHTPDNEGAAMFTAGGDSVLFRRVRVTSEIMRAGVAGLFGKR